MADFVVDNSIVMSWCFDDEEDDYADSVLTALETMTAGVPAVWPLEVANVLLVAERRKRLTKSDTIRFLELLRELSVEVIQEASQRVTSEIIALAREQQLSSYDASYLDLAIRKGLPLATLDARLRTAAKKCDVAFFDPDRL
ncbi:type II toxin-antitoxin system VapC family toxin [Candidatus Electrothrix sp.]|uniref:type II toxin-antitoxin system VapC family toxin n=1 Tax=Candidatus Electrothrix sp. TaxID=2170559 RepID=UPI0040567DE0